MLESITFLTALFFLRVLIFFTHFDPVFHTDVT